MALVLELEKVVEKSVLLGILYSPKSILSHLSYCPKYAECLLFSVIFRNEDKQNGCNHPRSAQSGTAVDDYSFVGFHNLNQFVNMLYG